VSKSILKLCIPLVVLILVGTRADAQAREYYNITDVSLYTGSGVSPAACDGSTDDTPAFQYVINNLAEPNQGTIVVPPGKTCVIGGFLDFGASVGVCLVGGIGAPALPYGPPPLLKFTGKAQSASHGGLQYPPALITFAHSSGFCMKNLFLEYTNANVGGAFLEGSTGNAQAAVTTAPTFQNLLITSSSNAVNSATCLISLDTTLQGVIDSVMFDRGQAAVCGVKQTSSASPADFSINNTVRNSFFNADGAIANVMILNPGDSWTIGPNNFFTQGNTNVPLLSMQSGFACGPLSFTGNLIANPAPSPSVNLISITDTGCSLTVKGNYFTGNSGSYAISMTSGTLVADGNLFSTVNPFALVENGVTAEIGVNEYSTSPSFPSYPTMGVELITYPQMTSLFAVVNTQGNFQVNGNSQLFNSMTVGGTLSKSAGAFKIDHPLDPAHKYLSHSFVESPEMENIYDGVVTLDKHGEAEVKLPAYFEALNRDFHYHLSCIGGFAPVFVSREVKNNSFHIAGGKAGLKVSWMVSGVRHDAYANEHRIQVEEDKTSVQGNSRSLTTAGASQQSKQD
jgi:hypothetical protein